MARAKKTAAPAEPGEKTPTEVRAEYYMRDEERALPTRYLRHDLTDAEKQALRLARDERDAEIARLAEEIAKLDAAKKRAKAILDGHVEQNALDSRTVRDGYDHRDVECWESEERVDGVLVRAVYRVDTWERIETAPLTQAERQGDLFDGAEAH
jgi:hypothetical protein